MEIFITILETVLTYIVQFSVTVLEFFGVFILVYTAVRCFISWTRKDHFVRLDLAQGIALALEFKLGGRSSGPSLHGTGTNSIYSARSYCSAVF